MRALLGLLLVAAFAAPVEAEPFFEAFGGKHFQAASDLSLSQPGLATDVRYAGVRWQGRSFEPSPYYGYRFGYFFESRPWLGLRLQFIHAKAIAETGEAYRARGVLDGQAVDRDVRLDSTVQAFEVTHGLNSVTLGALARHGLDRSPEHPRGRTQLYAGFGLGPVIAHTENTVRGANRERSYYVGGTPVFELFGGARFFLTRRWLALSEYKLTHTALTMDVAGGTAHARFDTHHLTFGVGFSL